ncbi:hypothetical protein T439DRAFT_356199 [Meredithblackwellia eburnea MCA 4105]
MTDYGPSALTPRPSQRRSGSIGRYPPGVGAIHPVYHHGGLDRVFSLPRPPSPHPYTQSTVIQRVPLTNPYLRPSTPTSAAAVSSSRRSSLVLPYGTSNTFVPVRPSTPPTPSAPPTLRTPGFRAQPHPLPRPPALRSYVEPPPSPNTLKKNPFVQAAAQTIKRSASTLSLELKGVVGRASSSPSPRQSSSSLSRSSSSSSTGVSFLDTGGNDRNERLRLGDRLQHHFGAGFGPSPPSTRPSAFGIGGRCAPPCATTPRAIGKGINDEVGDCECGQCGGGTGGTTGKGRFSSFEDDQRDMMRRRRALYK